MELYKIVGLVVLVLYLLALGLLMVNDTNKRVKHIENEFTLEGNK